MNLLNKNFIEQGEIKLYSDLRNNSYIIRVLNEDDFAAIMQLQDTVIESLKNKEYYMPITIEELENGLIEKGETIGLFINDELYAACSILNEIDYEENMGLELNFSNEDLTLVAQLHFSLVHNALRGHNLQQKLATILAERAHKIKGSRYIFTTVSPYNYPSIKTVTSMGLQIAKLCEMYYGWDRYVVYKDVINPIKLDTNNKIIVSSTSLEEQKQLLNNGYRGFFQYKDKDGIKIMYAKIMNLQRNF
ncbi:hypothetical protein SYNTR_1256 [Candidatus Syntrophocurvum alkaliphilum]|uniref:N-acetyltransferase domain-containing protein n=1 Tax=Candidatus Syntrophocurvum alkaliphilum TaxID=2293317 RepID=A0A6I6DC66_9FIRM|nr:hypothetical protein [Candidatus Syntrophocurvum alkaliphilum]QGT99849.1 hypothetical protein SYNTR_1256 [Candidatus Syntrophocurvum alkaliphilum]